MNLVIYFFFLSDNGTERILLRLMSNIMSVQVFILLYIYILKHFTIFFSFMRARDFFLYLRILNYFVNLKFLYKKIWQTKKWENDLIAINSSSLIISAWTNYRQNTDRQSLGLFSLIREFSDRNLWSRQKKAAFKEF